MIYLQYYFWYEIVKLVKKYLMKNFDSKQKGQQTNIFPVSFLVCKFFKISTVFSLMWTDNGCSP